jgi:hypothetical protein
MEILAQSIAEGKSCSPPSCIFLPEKQLVRSMIKAVLKHSKDTPDVFMLRFGILN